MIDTQNRATTEVLPVAASHFMLPPMWEIDGSALQSIHDACEFRRQAARQTLYEAHCLRPCNHTVHTPFDQRAPTAPANFAAHYKYDSARGIVSIMSAYGLLLSITDSRFRSAAHVECSPSVLVGASTSILAEAVGSEVLRQVVCEAQFRGDNWDDLCEANSAHCCQVCHVKPRTQHIFVPQSVNSQHTVTARLVSVCAANDCMAALHQQVEQRVMCGTDVQLLIDGRIRSLGYTYPCAFTLSTGDFDASTVSRPIEPIVLLHDQHGNAFALPKHVAAAAACVTFMPKAN